MSRFAAVFPGQGAQSVGMLAELAGVHPQVRETFEEASEVVQKDLWQLSQQGPAEALDATENTQPAMLAAGVAVWRVWRAQGGCAPVAMAGHSLGEYTALVCAGALDFPAAVALVAERARRMQAAVPAGQGAMAAILGLDDDAVRGVCAQAAGDEVVEAVNFNAPGQVVIAGHAAAVARAVEAARAAGARRSVPLAVSAPPPCTLMRPAAEALAPHLAEAGLRAPQVPVWQNVDARPHSEPAAIRDALAAQLYRPVRWTDTVRGLAAEGVGQVLEFGPGKVLTGLTRRIDRQLGALAIHDPAGLEQALALCEENGA